jgi:hypothetical protein
MEMTIVGALASLAIVLLNLSAGLIMTVIVMGVLVATVTVVAWLKKHKYRRVAARSAYWKRFEQMEADAEAKFGPSVELLRPEMQFDDDPELFNKVWRDFARYREQRARISRVASL